MKQKTPGYCALCISRCGCMSVVEDGVLKSVEPLPQHPTGKSICIKGKAAPEMVNSSKRILKPLKRTRPKGDDNAGWEEITWEQALDEISKKLQRIVKQSNPESVTFGVTTPSGTAISDSFMWINRLAHAFGSPNTLFATENCNWHKDFAPISTWGSGIGMPEYEKTDCILLWGFNPSTTWLSQTELIVKAQKRGAKLVVIDPRRVGLARRADQWLRVQPASDGILALALAYQMISNGWYDKSFIRDWSNGSLLIRDDTGAPLQVSDVNLQGSSNYFSWDKKQQKLIEWGKNQDNVALFGSLKVKTLTGSVTCRPAFQRYTELCSQYPENIAEQLTGVDSAQIVETARLIHESKAVSFFTWTGTAQQSQATQTGRAIALLYALTGSLDAPGGNVTFSKPPVNNLFGLDLLDTAQKSKTLGKQERPIGPSTMGWITSHDMYRSIVQKQPYETRALISFGANPLLTKPDAKGAIKALQQLEFYVHADMFHNPTSHLADIILPVASPWERSGLYSGFQISQQAENVVQLRPAVVPPRGQSRSDNWIVFELAKRLGIEKAFFEGDREAAMQKLIEPTGLTVEQLKAEPEGVTLSLKTNYRKYQQKGFDTPSKKVEIFSIRFWQAGYSALPEFSVEPEPDKNYPFRLISAKWTAYCHSQQRQLPSLHKQLPEPLVEIHPESAITLNIAEQDWVEIKTDTGKMCARVRFNKSLAKDVICSQYGWYNNGRSNYNGVISSTDFDPISSSNTLRNARCSICKL